MEQEKDTRVIFIKDLIFAALYQWRKIIIVAIALALVLGGIAGITQWKAVSSSQKETDSSKEQLEIYEENKDILERKLQDTQKRLENQKAYLSESPAMKLDPYGVYCASVDFSVQTGYQILPGMSYQNPDDTVAILHAYASILKSDYVLEEMASSIDTKSKYMTELLYINNGGSSTRALSITVTYYTAEGAQALLDIVVNCLESAKPQIEETVGAHDINVVASAVNERLDFNVTNTQNNALNQLQTLRTTLSDLEMQLDALEQPLVDTAISVKRIILLAVVGGILGAVLVVCAAWVGHITRGRIYSERTLKNRTGIKVLDCMPSSKTISSVDRWLRKLEGRSINDDQAAIAAIKVYNYCNNINSLLIAGDCDTSIRETLTDALKEMGLKVTSCGSLLHSPAALESLPKCDAVLLMTQCGSSLYADLEHEREIAEDQSNLLGCILVNG